MHTIAYNQEDVEEASRIADAMSRQMGMLRI